MAAEPRPGASDRLELRTLMARRQDAFTAVAWSPDGRWLASGSDDRAVRIWDALEGKPRLCLEGHQDQVTAVAWSPDGRWLAAASKDRTASIWNPETGKRSCVLEGHRSDVNGIAWSPDGKLLASASDDETVRIWDPESQEQRRVLRGHGWAVLAVAWAPDGRRIASACADRFLRVWGGAFDQEAGTFQHGGPVTGVCWSPDGQLLASSCDDRQVRTWRPESGRQLWSFDGHAGRIDCIAWAPDGRQLASGGRDKTARVLDVVTGEQVRMLMGHSDVVRGVAWSPDGAVIATASEDGTVRQWTAADGWRARVLSGNARAVFAAAWSPDGDLLAVASDQDGVEVWEGSGGERFHSLRPDSGLISSLAWSPDGTLLAMGSSKGTTQVVHATSGEQVATPDGHESWVRTIAWSPDGRLLVTGSYDKTLRVWSTETWTLLHVLEPDRGGAIYHASWSPDGTLIASCGDEPVIRVWDFATGVQRAVLAGHAGAILQTAWSPDREILASCSKDGTVRLWDPLSVAPPRVLEGHRSPVQSLAWAGMLLASVDENGAVATWHGIGPEGSVPAGSFHLLRGTEAYQSVGLAWRRSPGPVQQTFFGKTVLGDGALLSLPVGKFADLGSSGPVQAFGPAPAPSKREMPAVAPEPTFAPPMPCAEVTPGSAPSEAEHRAVQVPTRDVSAKVVLVGESEVGKSCLALRLAQDRYEEQGSTHGMRLWKLGPAQLGGGLAPPGERRELVLWDLGGQQEYRLVHQLFLHDTTVALVLIDPTRGEKAFQDAREWNLRLEKQLGGHAALKLLVGTKLDSDGAVVDQAGIDRLVREAGFAGFFPTSAKTARGISALKDAMAAAVDWRGLAQTSRPEDFAAIREAIDRHQQRAEVVLLQSDLEAELTEVSPEEPRPGAGGRDAQGGSLARELHSVVESVVAQLAMQGAVATTQIAGKRAVVLQIGEIERYAGALIQAARTNPRGLPVIELAEVSSSRALPGIPDAERLHPFQERFVIDCVVELLLEHGLCFRHQGLLVFPALFPQAEPEASAPAGIQSLYYDFSGAIDSIYSSLVARLTWSECFGRVRLWKDRAEWAGTGEGSFGIRKVDRKNGWGRLDLWFGEETQPDRRDLFTVLVEEHLAGQGVQLQEVLGMQCPCGYAFDEPLVRARIQLGHPDMVCPLCEAHLPISAGAKRAREADPELREKILGVKTVIDRRRQADVSEAKRTLAAPRERSGAEEPIRVLHLSDLHLRADDDVAALLEPLLHDLRRTEGGLGVERLDHLVVTGDLTCRASEQEFERAGQLLSELMTRMGVSAARLVLVPGNHDLDWDVDVYAHVQKRKFEPHAHPAGSWIEEERGYLVRDEERYPKRFERFGRLYHELTQQPFPLAPQEQGLSFLFEETGLQLLALNSSHQVDEYFPSRSGVHLGALARGLKQAGEQLERGGEGRAAPLRIAVLHHPVTGNEKIQEDAFLEQLAANGFELYLHGHVHQDRRDAVCHLDVDRDLRVVGAGSFGAPVQDRPEATPRLYNLLEIHRDRGLVRVQTRALRQGGGAWGPWAVWPEPGRAGGCVAWYEFGLRRSGSPSEQGGTDRRTTTLKGVSDS